jgi:hypothetical protein
MVEEMEEMEEMEEVRNRRTAKVPQEGNAASTWRRSVNHEVLVLQDFMTSPTALEERKFVISVLPSAVKNP